MKKKLFKIQAPKMPTDEELRVSYGTEYDVFHRVTDMNVWYDKLKKYTMPSWSLDLSKDEIKTLIDLADLIVDAGKLREIETRIDGAIDKNAFIKLSAFAKLNTRAPKDYCDCVFNNGGEVIRAFTRSMRTFEDLCMFMHLDAQCSIWFREYVEMDKRGEWRCFVRDKKVVGITQYFYKDILWLPMPVEYVQGMILRYSEHIIKDLGEDTFVFDIYYDYDKQEIMLIEINPYGSSDPCLLSYEEMDKAKGVIFKINN